MNRRRLMFIGAVSLALGGLFSLVVYRRLQKNTVSEHAPRVEVIVAATNIPVGKTIEDRDLQIVSYPADFLPPNVLHTKKSTVDHIAALPVEKGDFVTSFKLTNEAGLSGLIPRGLRAAPVRVNDIVSISGFVGPGSHVDVLVTIQTAQPSGMQAVTVLQNVRVLAADARMDRGNIASENAHAAVPSVVTLLVSPEDAQKLTLANQAGRIQLLLRNPTDTNEDQIPATRDLYGVTGVAKRPVKVKIVPAKLPNAPAGYTIQVIHGPKQEYITVQQ
jgi:pilus assembly protein CpaB